MKIPKTLKAKTVRLVFKIIRDEKEYTHDMVGIVTKIGSLAFDFEPFELDSFPLTYSQIISIEEIVT